MNRLYILTGPAGVGKSTISNEIAKANTYGYFVHMEKNGKVSF